MLKVRLRQPLLTGSNCYKSVFTNRCIFKRSLMTMPIPAIADDAWRSWARGLKSAGSRMWTGTPIPQNLSELSATGVPLAANVKPSKDRDKLFALLDDILVQGVTWVGIELDAAQGTKIGDKDMGYWFFSFSLKEIRKIEKRAPVPQACKGVLSRIIVDGSFQRGSEVLKGFAFGASLVGLERPILYALAAGGEKGMSDLITGITRELSRLMTMVGAKDPTRVEKGILIQR